MSAGTCARAGGRKCSGPFATACRRDDRAARTRQLANIERTSRSGVRREAIGRAYQLSDVSAHWQTKTRDAHSLATAARADDDFARLLDRLLSGAQVADLEFDAIYPQWVRRLSEQHWTPLDVCIRAAELLVTDERSTVLDVGSGAGKFCLIGAASTGATFVGVEQRPRLVRIARETSRRAGVTNVEFITTTRCRSTGGSSTLSTSTSVLRALRQLHAAHRRTDRRVAAAVQQLRFTACVKLFGAKPERAWFRITASADRCRAGFRRILREPAGSEYLELWEKNLA